MRHCATRAPRSRCCLAVLVALPTLAAMWFAPGLVVFQDLPAFSALAHSLRAAAANWRPLVLYAQWRCSCLAGCCPASRLALLSLVLPASTGPLIAVALLMPYMFFRGDAAHLRLCELPRRVPCGRDARAADAREPGRLTHKDQCGLELAYSSASHFRPDSRKLT